MNTVIRPFAAGELDELALLAQRLQARRETSSSFCCAKAADIWQDFSGSIEYGFACWADGRPLGLVSCFPDPEKSNADCSLLLDAQGAAYPDLAKALLAAAREKLSLYIPASISHAPTRSSCSSWPCSPSGCMRNGRGNI